MPPSPVLPLPVLPAQRKVRHETLVDGSRKEGSDGHSGTIHEKRKKMNKQSDDHLGLVHERAREQSAGHSGTNYENRQMAISEEFMRK